MKEYTLSARELITVMEQTFQSEGVFPLGITGWSMRPLLRHGQDRVLLKPFSWETCGRGTILLYERPDGHLVLHRVRKCLPEGYRMNGDAQTWCEKIAPGQVLAQVSHICRGNKTLAVSDWRLWLWNLIWYPTRPIRPVLFQVGHQLKKLNPGSESF